MHIKDPRMLNSKAQTISTSGLVSDHTSLKIQLDPGFWTRTSWIQLMYGIWVNFCHLGIGLAMGLSAVQVPQLASPDSRIRITREEASWIASILTLFSPIGCLISGYVVDRYGRRIMIIVCQAPMCVGWMYTGFAKTPRDIIIGKAITGIGCGMAMGPPRIFCTEIALPNMRGVIGAFSSIALSVGITVQAGLGKYFDWHILCFICAGFTFFNLIFFNLLPETPYYVLKTGTEDEARKTLAKYRGSKYDLNKEMSQLIDFKEENDIRKLGVFENIKILFTRASCKPFCIIQTYVLITQCSGISSILMWAIEILTMANSSFDVHTGNFLLAMTRLVVGTITSVLLFRVGRKPLALTSAIGVSFVCYTVGFYIRYNDDPSLIPQIFFMAYMGFASLGYYTLPFLMAAELYPLQVRGTLGGITVSITSILIFGSTKLYATFRDSIGLGYTMVLYGSFSLFGAIFLYFFLPETKELTLQEIEEYYNDRRPTLVSQRRIMSMQLHHDGSTLSKSKFKSNSGLKTNEKFKAMKLATDIIAAGGTAAQAVKAGAHQQLSSLLGNKEQQNSDSTTETSMESLKKKEALKINDAVSIKEHNESTGHDKKKKGSKKSKTKKGGDEKDDETQASSSKSQ